MVKIFVFWYADAVFVFVYKHLMFLVHCGSCLCIVCCVQYLRRRYCTQTSVYYKLTNMNEAPYEKLSNYRLHSAHDT
jgi:hypothetical protein